MSNLIAITYAYISQIIVMATYTETIPKIQSTSLDYKVHRVSIKRLIVFFFKQ